jgi:hypothetical protein
MEPNNELVVPESQPVSLEPLSATSTEGQTQGAGAIPLAAAVELRSEALKSLYQCAQDNVLPLRYREVALQNLEICSNRLRGDLIRQAMATVPPVNAVLGTSVKLPPGSSSVDVYREIIRLHKSAEGPPPPTTLGMYLSEPQMKRLEQEALSNPVIAEVLESSSLQQNLLRLSSWARQEMGHLPWREARKGVLLFDPAEPR